MRPFLACILVSAAVEVEPQDTCTNKSPVWVSRSRERGSGGRGRGPRWVVAGCHACAVCRRAKLLRSGTRPPAAPLAELGASAGGLSATAIARPRCAAGCHGCDVCSHGRCLGCLWHSRPAVAVAVTSPLRSRGSRTGQMLLHHARGVCRHASLTNAHATIHNPRQVPRLRRLQACLPRESTGVYDEDPLKRELRTPPGYRPASQFPPDFWASSAPQR